MLTPERTRQFTYLLTTILHIAGKNISSHDAGIVAFLHTAETFGIEEPTVRDMVTRSCNVQGVATFYDAVAKLYEGDKLTFETLYFNHIPQECRRELDGVCRRFADAPRPASSSSPSMAFFLKLFERTREPAKKRMLLSLLEKDLSSSLSTKTSRQKN
ncbi:hypothetical protein [uncultured Mailhella sp.]|uniref:hypothetical protein n=1 Tax=uncultured Mailhella sp. TaxID=1981031 RepID=UPI0025D34D1C|nr:hypothetical protein [uncultured Mailhella sp.]